MSALLPLALRRFCNGVNSSSDALPEGFCWDDCAKALVDCEASLAFELDASTALQMLTGPSFVAKVFCVSGTLSSWVCCDLPVVIAGARLTSCDVLSNCSVWDTEGENTLGD